jgi:hypothetical protein
MGILAIQSLQSGGQLAECQAIVSIASGTDTVSLRLHTGRVGIHMFTPAPQLAAKSFIQHPGTANLLA